MQLGRLALRLTAFLLPFALLLVAAVGVAVYGGEAMPLGAVFALQADDPTIIYSPAGREMNYRYKLYGLRRQRHDIVLIGTSVVRYVRADWFAPETTVYNAYLPSGLPHEFSVMMRQFTPETAPAVAIIAIDAKRLSNTGRRNLGRDADALDLTPAEILDKTRSTLQTVLTGAQTLEQVLSRTVGADSRRLGLSATAEGRGFRYDGSIWYQTDALDTAERLRAETLTTVRDSVRAAITVPNRRAEVEGDVLRQLIQDVADLEALGVQVIGVIMPFSMPSIMDVMPGTAYEADVLATLDTVTAGFVAAGAEVFDFYDPRPLGITDADMVDGEHLSEAYTRQLVETMLQRSPSLHQFARGE